MRMALNRRFSSFFGADSNNLINCGDKKPFRRRSFWYEPPGR